MSREVSSGKLREAVLPEPKVIGIGGLLYAGKDAVADHLVSNHGWVKLGMSDALANMLYILNPLIPYIKSDDGGFLRFMRFLGLAGPRYGRYQELYSEYHPDVAYVEVKKLPEVRALLQRLGTEVGRDMISKNLWVDLTSARIKEHTDIGFNVIVTGIRFPNELDMIHSLGGTTVWVERPEAGGTAETAAHVSEASLSSKDFDFTLRNDFDLEFLGNETDRLLERIK